MPDDDSAVIENGVWYIGNIAQALVICRPGAIGLVPAIDSAAGPIVVMPNCASPVCTSAMFCIGPPVTSRAARDAKLFCHEVGPARAIDEERAALAGGAHGKAFGPAGAVFLRVDCGCHEGNGGHAGEKGVFHVYSSMSAPG